MIVDENSANSIIPITSWSRKSTSDFEALGFNTAIAQMMVFINDCYKAKAFTVPISKGFVKMFSCVCPFVGEEMWQKLGHEEMLTYVPWPTYDESKLVKKEINLAISINGKTREVIAISPDASEDEAKERPWPIRASNPSSKGKTIKKIIYVKGRSSTSSPCNFLLEKTLAKPKISAVWYP